ncbi:unnamed protein product [Camellia sinensis]
MRISDVPWYWYVLLGFIDVQGNYLFNKAYEYSSITSVTLLDCWTIPWVIVLTWFIMATRYSLWQLFGAAICVTGLCLVLLSDAGVGGGGGSKPLLGDLLVIAATLFYAMSNVGEILMSGATMFNLSILTSDMWAVVIRIFFYHQQVDWLYYLSFAIEVVGLVIYSKTEKDPIPAQALVDGNLDAQYQVLGEESAESTNEVIAS